MNLERAVDELGGLSVSTWNLLRREGISSRREVAILTDDELLALRQVGPKTLAELRHVCGRRTPTPWDRAKRRRRERALLRRFEAWKRKEGLA